MTNDSGWNQKSISLWAEDTFGTPSNNMTIAVRANEEMSELLGCLASDDDSEKAMEEIADVVIVLMRLMDRLGGDLHAAIERKMILNVQRVWKLRGNGCGDHI